MRNSMQVAIFFPKFFITNRIAWKMIKHICHFLFPFFPGMYFMHKSIFIKKIVPIAFSYALLFITALAVDAIFHVFNLSWVGRYFGILGTLLLFISFLYSMKKRKLIKTGSPKMLLHVHEYTSWFGTVLVLIHAGVHFNALLPWLAVIALLVVVASGHTGKYLLTISRDELNKKKQEYQMKGLDEEAVSKAVFIDALSVNVMIHWRTIHLPFVFIFLVLGALHILSIFFFWNWS